MGIRTLVVVGLSAWAGWLLVRGILRRKVPWLGLGLIAVPLVGPRHHRAAVGRRRAPLQCRRPSPGSRHRTASTASGSGRPSRTPVPSSATSTGTRTAYRPGPRWCRTRPADVSPPTAAPRAPSGPTPPLDQVIAVHVLTHEAMHLAGRLRGVCCRVRGAAARRLGRAAARCERGRGAGAGRAVLARGLPAHARRLHAIAPARRCCARRVAGRWGLAVAEQGIRHVRETATPYLHHHDMGS